MEKAAELNPDLARVQTRLAGLRVWSEWDWEGGLEAFQRALEADPLDSETRAYFSQLLLYLNRDDEALAQAERAIQLEPFNTLVLALYAMDLNALHRFDDAEEVLLQALDRDAEAPIVLSTLRTTYHLMGRHEDAIRMWRASYEAVGDTAALQALNRGYAQGGYGAALTAVADLFVERSDTAYVTPWQIATLYTRAGRGEEALHYLELAFQEHDQNMPYITTDPIFDFLREEPRFQELVDRLGLPVH
jgi:tetratricopeptide (TPR) repeat protein